MNAEQRQLYQIITGLSIILVVIDIVELARLLPEILHACKWPAEQVYGGYEDVMFNSILVSACLQFANLIVVAVWYHRALQPDPVPVSKTIQLESFTIGYNQRPFDAWNKCGFPRNRLPVIVYMLQTASILSHAVLLAFHHVFVICIALSSILCSFLVIFYTIFVPFVSVADMVQLSITGKRLQLPTPGKTETNVMEDPDRIRSDNFRAHTCKIVTLALGITVALVIAYLLQHFEMFASGSKYYTTAQLRIMNDDRHPYNRPLLFHEWSNNLTRAVGEDKLPYDRVVLIVLDGMRYDYLFKNAAFKNMLFNSTRTPHFSVQEMQAALPTMSAPNWLTILTGAKPEITGLHGNILTAETEFDNLFARQSRLDNKPAPLKSREFMRGMTGGEWWSELIKTHFPRVRGDGSNNDYSNFDVTRRENVLPLDMTVTRAEQRVPLPYLSWFDPASSNGHTDDVTDQFRTEVAIEALNDTLDPFRFFLVHFANIDTQAHYHGTTREFNRRDSYQTAVTRTVGYIQRILDVLDAHPLSSHTHVIITADHGEVDPGGHGGTEDILRRIPFILYYPLNGVQPTKTTTTNGKSVRSAMETRVQKGAQPPLSIEDVTASVSALLGLPVPRQSSGKFPRAVWDRIPPDRRRLHARDLYESKRERLNVFLIESRYTSREYCQLAYDYPLLLQRNQTFVDFATANEFLDKAAEMETLYESLRSNLLDRIMARNIGLSILLMFFILYLLADTIAQHSLVSMSLFQPVPKRATTTYAACVTMQNINLRALATAISLSAAYIGITLGLLLIVYSVTGYTTWDSTMAHTVSACLRFFLIAIVPGIIVEFLIVRAYHAPYMLLDRDPLTPQQQRKPGMHAFHGVVLALSNVLRFFFMEATFYYGYVQDLTFVYFTRLYMMFISLVVWATLVVCQSVYSFVLPFVFSNWVITETTWGIRFRVLSAQLVCLPLLVGNACVLLSFSERNKESMPWTTIEKAQQHHCIVRRRHPVAMPSVAWESPLRKPAQALDVLS